jgi:hypothetical protein
VKKISYVSRTSIHAHCLRQLEITEHVGSAFPLIMSWRKEASHLEFFGDSDILFAVWTCSFPNSGLAPIFKHFKM